MSSSERHTPVYQCIPTGLKTMENTANIQKRLSLMYLLDHFVLFVHVVEMLRHINTIDPRGASLLKFI